MMAPYYSYPYHMKVVKHILYVERGCGNFSMMAKSLNGVVCRPAVKWNFG
jgi:hypothetical protein